MLSVKFAAIGNLSLTGYNAHKISLGIAGQDHRYFLKVFCRESPELVEAFVS